MRYREPVFARVETPDYFPEATEGNFLDEFRQSYRNWEVRRGLVDGPVQGVGVLKRRRENSWHVRQRKTMDVRLQKLAELHPEFCAEHYMELHRVTPNAARHALRTAMLRGQIEQVSTGLGGRAAIQSLFRLKS